MNKGQKIELLFTVIVALGLLGGTLWLTWVLLDPARYVHQAATKTNPP
jgi:hypothetical protein